MDLLGGSNVGRVRASASRGSGAANAMRTLANQSRAGKNTTGYLKTKVVAGVLEGAIGAASSGAKERARGDEQLETMRRARKAGVTKASFTTQGLTFTHKTHNERKMKPPKPGATSGRPDPGPGDAPTGDGSGFHDDFIK